MKFGIAITTSVNPATTAEGQARYVTEMTDEIERLGFDSLWVSDRTVYPNDLVDRYPDMYGPGLADPDAQNVLEAVTTLSYAAGRTENTRLGVSVLVLPFRNAVLNTKMLNTLDQLSNGRLILGVGTGWMPEEFDSMDASFEQRGAVTDEHLDLFRASEKSGDPSVSGDHVQLDGMKLFPQAIQHPRVPVWIGGNSSRALRRTAEYGDSWHCIRLTPDEVSAQRSNLIAACETAGREPDEVGISIRTGVTMGSNDTGHDHSEQRGLMTGEPAQIIEDIESYRAAGVDYMVLSVVGNSTEQTIENLNAFNTDVRPHFG
ncbi:MAG: LLM class flavin-dependent oxidoreductase [Chloroflexi bacterium]|nr:LLM class flavin-dependent oxidoreductase [Chloroflexota bacterium]MBT4515552.1 LLM class flavin-dependent oxidoreductase [Chloroflexota bacterium]